MSHQHKKQQFGNEDKEGNEEDIRSIEGSEWSLEEENIVSHGNAKQKEESNSKIALLEANNKTLEGKLENLELKAQIRAMTEEANLNKLKEENQAIRARMEAAEEKAQMAKNELESTIKEIQNKMDESAAQMAIYYDEQLKVQKQDLEAEMLKQMATLKDLLKSQGINLDHMKSPDIPWTDLIEGKRLANPNSNRWEKDTDIQISENGLNATVDQDKGRYIFAEKEFCLSVEECRKDNFAGIIIHYFEVTKMSSTPTGQICIGLSNGDTPHSSHATNSPNCYALLELGDCCFLSGKIHSFKWPTGANIPEWNGQGDVLGCGILMSPDPENKMFIFFTLNGVLMGTKIAIGHPGECLYPTVRLCDSSVEANFGNDSTKPFCYDINKCPGLDIE